MIGSQSEKKLATLPKLSCDVCAPDISKYYDISFDIVQKNQKLLDMAMNYSQGSKLLTAGRVLVLRDGVRRN